MNKFAVLIILGLGLLVLGCAAQTGAPAGEQIKYVCPDRTTVASPELCSSTTARALSDEEQLSVCTGMPEYQGTSLEEACIMGLAAKNKDSALCLKVGRETRPRCYAMVANAKGDIGVCQEAGTYKDRCYNEYATNYQDASACDKIGDVSMKDSCYSNMVNTLGDPTLCNKVVSVGQKDSCYWNIAMRLRDVSYCNKITSADQKQNCLQNIQGSSGGYAVPVQQPK